MLKKNREVEPQFVPSILNNQMLNYKVYYMSFTEKVFYFLLTFIAGGIVGLIFYGGLFKTEGKATTVTMISNIVVFCLVGLIGTKFFIPAIRKGLKNKRDKVLRKQFMNLLEDLSVSLAAGNTLNDSFINAKSDMQNQYSEKDMIIQELIEINSGLDNGHTLEEMITAFGNRAGNEDIENFANVVSNCYRMGGNFKDVIRKTRDIISDKIAIEEEIETKLASNKLQHKAMCLMPIALVGMLKISSSSFAANLSSFMGVIITTIAIVIFVISYFWGQKIISIK
ncbi:MAG: type II secretion system F family protein [Eubacteriales bacterium]|nr:type II secretion system F family protein [Eubacteriales bacterium]